LCRGETPLLISTSILSFQHSTKRGKFPQLEASVPCANTTVPCCHPLRAAFAHGVAVKCCSCPSAHTAPTSQSSPQRTSQGSAWRLIAPRSQRPNQSKAEIIAGQTKRKPSRSGWSTAERTPNASCSPRQSTPLHPVQVVPLPTCLTFPAAPMVTTVIEPTATTCLAS